MKHFMYTGGLGPYMEVNGVRYPEKTVVAVPEDKSRILKWQRKFIEVKGIGFAGVSGTFNLPDELKK